MPNEEVTLRDLVLDKPFAYKLSVMLESRFISYKYCMFISQICKKRIIMGFFLMQIRGVFGWDRKRKGTM